MMDICLTVHNKENIIKQVVRNIIENSTGEYRLIVCLDGCTDNSAALFWETMSECHNYFNPPVVLIAPNVFETKANNLCAKYGINPYIIFVQDDMIITENGWNERLIKPIQAFDDVFAVTARCAHNWRVNPDSKDRYSGEVRTDRWSDILFHCDHADKNNTGRDKFAIRASVNRGPLAVRRDIFEKLGGFDEAYAPLSFDDHDLMFRARKEYGMKCGYYGIDWHSRPEWGGTRDNNGGTRPFVYASDFRNARLFAERHHPMATISESRDLL